MAGVKANITHTDFVLISRLRGEIGNLYKVRALADPAGATGATTVTVDGLNVTIKLKNTSGAVLAATVAEVFAALSGSTDVQALFTLTAGSATGASTGAALTGPDSGYAAGASGASGAVSRVYDTLAEATSDKWRTYTQTDAAGAVVDVLETLPLGASGAITPDGFRRAAAAHITGASGAVKAAGNWVDRQSRLGQSPAVNRG